MDYHAQRRLEEEEEEPKEDTKDEIDSNIDSSEDQFDPEQFVNQTIESARLKKSFQDSSPGIFGSTFRSRFNEGNKTV